MQVKIFSRMQINTCRVYFTSVRHEYQNGGLLEWRTLIVIPYTVNLIPTNLLQVNNLIGIPQMKKTLPQITLVQYTFEVRMNSIFMWRIAKIQMVLVKILLSLTCAFLSEILQLITKCPTKLLLKNVSQLKEKHTRLFLIRCGKAKLLQVKNTVIAVVEALSWIEDLNCFECCTQNK